MSFFDASIICNMSWEDHLRWLGESWGGMDTTKIYHLDYLVNVQGAQDEIQDVLDRCTYIAANRVGDGIVRYRAHRCLSPESSLLDKIMRVINMVQ